MKTLLATCALFLCVYTCSAQTDTAKKQNTTPAKKDSTEKTYIKPEVESEFPGGLEGWKEFLQNNLRYPSFAVRERIQGTVILQFIVCSDGTVCDIEAVSGPIELRQSAINALKKTPNWKPAIQDGQNVRSYKKQPIIYSLQRN
jgi:periplasmic protein TonB